MNKFPFPIMWNLFCQEKSLANVDIPYKVVHCHMWARVGNHLPSRGQIFIFVYIWGEEGASVVVKIAPLSSYSYIVCMHLVPFLFSILVQIMVLSDLQAAEGGDVGET